MQHYLTMQLIKRGCSHPCHRGMKDVFSQKQGASMLDDLKMCKVPIAIFFPSFSSFSIFENQDSFFPFSSPVPFPSSVIFQRLSNHICLFFQYSKILFTLTRWLELIKSPYLVEVREEWTAKKKSNLSKCIDRCVHLCMWNGDRRNFWFEE